MILLLPFILGLFFVLTSFYVLKKSQIFFLFYFVLFAYTFFSQLGYLLYPEELSLVSNYQYYGEKAFIPYWIYIFLSFVYIFIIFAIFYNRKYRSIFSIKVKPSSKKGGNFLYTIFILSYGLILSFFLLKNYENLSYYNQGILKNNKIWFYLFSLGGVVLLSIFFKILIEKEKKKKFFYSVIFFSVLLIFSLTAIRSGQRVEIAMALLGFLLSLQYLFRGKIGIKQKLKFTFIILIISFIFISFSQAVRMTRGYNESPAAFITILMIPETYLIIFSLKTLVFQDWLIPSLTLITSIELDIVFPCKVIESNLGVLIPFIEHKSLGDILSRIIAPESNAGFGYYILTEGYNFMGFFGIMYSSLIFALGIRLWESFFINTEDRIFNAFMYGIMGFLAIGVVRGQTIIFLKGLYLYFLPAIILYILMSNKKVYLTGLKIKTEVN
jgi:hypothetical protein